MREIIKKYSAYAVAVFVFVLLSCIYCYPELKGKRIFAGDTAGYRSAVNELATYARKTGKVSCWTGSMFSGMPSYQIESGIYKSKKYLAPVNNITHKGHRSPIWALVLYFLCFFVVLRSFEVDKWLSIVGAVAMGLSSYFLVIIGVGHNTKASTIPLMCVVVAGQYLLFRGKYLAGALMCMLFTCVSYSYHPQMSYYLFMFMGVIWACKLVEAIGKRDLRKFGIVTAIFVLSVAVGVATGSSNVFANAEYAKETMRGGQSDLVTAVDGNGEEAGEKPARKSSAGLALEYATRFSYGIDETMSLMIPGFKGGSSNYPLGKESALYKGLRKGGEPEIRAEKFCKSSPLYWGEQPFTAGNVYVGAIVCLLFVLGLMIVRGPLKWAMLIATVFSIMLAWGHNFMWLSEFFFKYFPLYSKFRAVSSILVVAEVAMPLLGFLALKQLMDEGMSRKEKEKKLLVAVCITGGICLFFALFGPLFYDFCSSWDDKNWRSQYSWIAPYVFESRKNLLRSDSFRSLLFILASSLVLLLFIKGKMPKYVLVASLLVLVLADMWPVDKRYLNDSKFSTVKNVSRNFEKFPYEEQLLKDPDPNFRVMNFTVASFSDARTSMYLKSIGGYSAAKLRRYNDVIEHHLKPLHKNVYSMLNAKYFITADESGEYQVERNEEAMGNAWFVEEVRVVPDAKAECDAINEIDLHKVAVAGPEFSEFAAAAPKGGKGEIRFVSYKPDRLEYEYSAAGEATIIFSEIYYPHGWKATIDGKNAEHYRANYILRAMNVPAGKHNIVFTFYPDSVRKGDIMSMIAIGIMYAFALFALAVLIRNIIVKFARKSE